MKTIHIIGTGAIGKALAVSLALDNKPVVLVRGSADHEPPTRRQLSVHNDDGILQAAIDVRTLSDFDTLDGPVVLTNKSFGNAALAISLKDKVNDAIVLLQNGLGIEAPFVAAGMAHVYRCVLFVTSQTLSADAVRFRPVAVSPVGVVKGSRERAEELVAGISSTHFPFRFEAHIDVVVWRKAIINCVFNSVCPLLEADNGIFHRNAAALAIARRVIDECLVVARHKGIALTHTEVVDNLLLISRSSDGQLISTLQDIRNKRPTEIDTLNFEIARMAAALNLAHEVRETLLLGELTRLKADLARNEGGT